MISRQYTITAPEGIHARPATALVRIAKKFQSIALLKKGDKTVRLNSMLNILTLGAKGGDAITIEVEGPDEEEAAGEIDFFFREQLHTL